MKPLSTSSIGTLLAALAIAGSAVAQTPYHDDLVCRQYADQNSAAYRDQTAAAGVGSALVGAGLGAALGAAVGGGRGAGIGAASGAIAGTGVGVANAQQAQGQYWHSLYASCMQSRQPAYGAAPAYGQPYGAPPPAYAPAYGAPQPYYGYPR